MAGQGTAFNVFLPLPRTAQVKTKNHRNSPSARDSGKVIMKKLFAFIFACFCFVSVPVNVESDDTLDYVSYMPVYIDLLELPSLVSAYSRDKSVMDKYENAYSIYPETGISSTDVFNDDMDTLLELNYLLLPDFIDISNIKTGDFTVTIGDVLSFYEITGEYNGSDFTLSCFGDFTGDWDSWRTSPSFLNLQKSIGNIIIKGSYKSWEKKLNGSLSYGNKNEFYFVADNKAYEMIIDGEVDFDDIWDELDFYIFPLRNGFIEFNDNLYYSYNEKLLIGWYRIKDDVYHFNEDGTASKGVEVINGKTFLFDSNGVYKQSIEPTY